MKKANSRNKLTPQQEDELRHIFKLLGKDGRLSLMLNIALIEAFYTFIYKKEVGNCELVRYFLLHYVKKTENGYYADVNFPNFATFYINNKLGLPIKTEEDYKRYIKNQDKPLRETVEDYFNYKTNDRVYNLLYNFVEKNKI